MLNSSDDFHNLYVYRESKLTSLSSQDTNKIPALSLPEKIVCKKKQNNLEKITAVAHHTLDHC